MSSQHYEKEFSKALVQLERTGKATFNDFLEFLALSIRFLSMPDPIDRTASQFHYNFVVTTGKEHLCFHG